MKRFRWPLQRLLDVTKQRELARRAELLRTSREMARIRQGILYRRRVIRASLNELSKRTLAARIPDQEVVMVCSAGREKEIEQLTRRLTEVESQRKENIARLVQAKKKRETLEKMREKARQAHLKQQLKLEQKQLDESAHVSFAHRARAERTATESTGD